MTYQFQQKKEQISLIMVPVLTHVTAYIQLRHINQLHDLHGLVKITILIVFILQYLAFPDPEV